MGSLGSLPVTMLIMAIGMSLGGTTGYAINPARDLPPRLAHALLPIRGKGGSGWDYSWVPVAGPRLGARAAGLIYGGVYFCVKRRPETRIVRVIRARNGRKAR